LTWDPRCDGAQCDRCILNTIREGGPVRSEFHPSKIVALGEFPDENEVEQGRPLTGRVGLELHRALDIASVKRKDLSYVNAFACRPVGNNLAKMKTALRRENVRRAKTGEEPLLEPVAACRGRLLADIAHADSVIVLGKVAYEALIPEQMGDDGRPKKHPSIDAVQGNLTEVACRDGKVRQMVPTIHPMRVLFKPRWRLPFRASVARAFRWFRGALVWKDPEIVINPPLSWLNDHAYEFLTSQNFIVYDTETDALEPCLANLRCIQIGTGDYVIVIALLSRDGHTRFYDSIEQQWLFDYVKTTFKNAIVVGHNAGSYDRQVMERYLGEPPKLDIDTVILHRYVDPDLPHSLGFIGSLYTDVHAWKADHTATEAKTDAELWHYGAMDVSVNHNIAAVLIKRANEIYGRVQAKTGPDMRPMNMPIAIADGDNVPNPSRILKDPVLIHDHSLQVVCCEMHQLGVRVNERRRKAHETRMVEQRAFWLARLQDSIAAAGIGLDAGFDDRGKPLFNPGSTDHMRKLLFEKWELPFPEHLPKKSFETDSGDRVAADVILRAYLADMTLSKEQHAIIHACRRAKKFQTLLGRFVFKLAPYEVAEEARRLAREKARLKGKRPPDEWLCVWPDGRLRANWSVHTTGVGRLSSGGKPSKINLQTFPAFMRDMFEPEEGHVFVGADLSSVHSRIIANVWGIPSLRADYLATPQRDTHVSLAKIIYSDFDETPGHPCEENNFEWSGPAKVKRNVAKALRFNGAYGGSVPTIHATMTRAEDDEGNLVMRSLTVTQVRAYYERWMGAEPEWRQAWDKSIALFKKYGYMLDPILGRRADFSDGEDYNAIINYPILAAEGAIMGPATIRVRNRVRPHSWGRNTGIIGQFHDQIVLEVPEDRKEEGVRLLEEEMNVTVPGWDIPIGADGKWGMDLTFKSKVRK
jgi:uracil-DNA glycosylase family 4